MVIIGTEKIRAVLDLPGAKIQIKKGEKRYVSEKDYWGSDVQNAITLGFLKADKSTPEVTSDTDRVARVKNISGKPISIPNFTDEVKVDAVFTIRESRLKESAFQTAIACKMIKLLGIVGAESSLEEGSVFIDTGEEVQPSKDEETVSPDSEVTIPLTRDFFKGRKDKEVEPLETNVEIKPRGVIDTPDPSPVTNKETGDPRKKSVVWNPTKQPVFVETEQPIEPPPPPPAIQETDPKKNSIAWDPTLGKGNETVISEPKKTAEIKFVDEEQEIKKIASHPKKRSKKNE